MRRVPMGVGTGLAGLLTAAACWVVPAHAEDLIVPATGTTDPLAGSKLYDLVQIDGPLSVLSYQQDGDGPSGWLHLRAREIVIGEGGVIDAFNKGYRGTEDGATGYDAGGGESPALIAQPMPAGGGAHVGAGGPGMTISGCTLFAEAGGGQAYDGSGAPLGLSGTTRLGGLGSAGGTAWGLSGADDWPQPGGGGGGMVILEAATVTLDGAIWAHGQDALVSDATGYGIHGAPAGGGAGGTVIILAPSFSYGPNAEITARGGAGAVDSAQELVVGGSGGGGRITLRIGTEHAALASQLHVEGGAGHTTCSGSAGQPGLAEIIEAPDCVDADQDGYESEACGGDDCNDTDEDVHPNQAEICNLVDDDCSGEVDEPNPNPDDLLCPQGPSFLCVDGECTEDPDAGIGPSPQSPSYIEVGGGFCATGPNLRTTASYGAPLGLLLLLGAALFRRRSTRNVRSARADR